MLTDLLDRSLQVSAGRGGPLQLKYTTPAGQILLFASGSCALNIPEELPQHLWKRNRTLFSFCTTYTSKMAMRPQCNWNSRYPKAKGRRQALTIVSLSVINEC